MKKKVRVVFIAGQLGLGGAERQLYYLANGLERAGFQISIINLSPDLDHYWGDRFQTDGIPVWDVPRFNLIIRVWRIRQLIQRWQPDIIHSFHYHANMYAVIANGWCSVPVIGSIRNLPTSAHLGESWLRRRLGLYGVNCLVCNAAASRQMLLESYPSLKNVRVITNGVYVPVFSEIEDMRSRSHVKLGVRDDDLLVGYVGHLNDRKNVALLIRAVAYLMADFPFLKLIIIGDGRQRNQLEKLTWELGLHNIVIFTGFHPLAEQMMPSFDILCLPSNLEGMPNVLMEAAVMGVPCVATDLAGIREVILDGQTGFLFSPNNLDSLIHHLHRLLQDKELRKRMGLAAREYIQSNYSVEKMVEQYINLYGEIAFH